MPTRSISAVTIMISCVHSARFVEHLLCAGPCAGAGDTAENKIKIPSPKGTDTLVGERMEPFKASTNTETDQSKATVKKEA